MILSNTKKHIVLNAGHFIEFDNGYFTGAVVNQIREADEAIRIRDRVVPLLEKLGFKVSSVPDNLNLRRSIEWANEKASKLNDALAISIHLNYFNDPNVRGTEAFYIGGSKTSQSIAEALARNVSEALGIPNRGARPDTQTAVGALGWIRETKAWASLVEICYMSYPADMKILQGVGGYEIAARGITLGICEIFGVQKLTNIEKSKEEIKLQIIELLKKL